MALLFIGPALFLACAQGGKTVVEKKTVPKTANAAAQKGCAIPSVAQDHEGHEQEKSTDPEALLAEHDHAKDHVDEQQQPQQPDNQTPADPHADHQHDSQGSTDPAQNAEDKHEGHDAGTTDKTQGSGDCAQP